MAIDPARIRSCGICCGIFSLFAIIFLCIVGSIIQSGSLLIGINDSQRSGAASAAFTGAGIYAGCVGLSIICYLLPIFLRGHSNDDLRSMQAEHRANRLGENISLTSSAVEMSNFVSEEKRD